MKTECFKNFDALFAIAEDIGTFPNFPSAGVKARYTVYLHPYKVAERFSFTAPHEGKETRGIAVAGDNGYILIGEDGSTFVHEAYQATELYCEPGFMTLFVNLVLTGIPLVTLIELLDLSTKADYAAVVAYRELKAKLEDGVRALMAWDARTV